MAAIRRPLTAKAEDLATRSTRPGTQRLSGAIAIDGLGARCSARLWKDGLQWRRRARFASLSIGLQKSAVGQPLTLAGGGATRAVLSADAIPSAPSVRRLSAPGQTRPLALTLRETASPSGADESGDARADEMGHLRTFKSSASRRMAVVGVSPRGCSFVGSVGACARTIQYRFRNLHPASRPVEGESGCQFPITAAAQAQLRPS